MQEAIENSTEATLSPARKVIESLASLKLTVTLFALGIFLTFAGTLAQVDHGIWTILEKYFRTFFAMIPMQVFFPRSMNIPGAFPFPGGWTIGGLLLINLILAHSLRFKVVATGRKKVIGLLVTLVGLTLTGMVISGFFAQQLSATEGDAFWRVAKRLIHGGLAAIVLLAGCRMLFGRQGPMVLLHGGIVIILLSELSTGLFAKESRMTIQEGGSANYTVDIRTPELAIIQSINDEEEKVIAVPESLIKKGQRMSHDALPFDYEVVKYFINSDLVRPQETDAENIATDGIGLRAIAVDAGVNTGVDTRGEVDRPAAYIKLFNKHGDKKGTEIGTYLVSAGLGDSFNQPIEVDGETYNFIMRFERNYRDYEVELVDFIHDIYPGTTIPKDYRSVVIIKDPGNDIERQVNIYMNNPLRFRGETFYQSSFIGSDTTILQVVRNHGWMAPYVACMVVGIGLIDHFCQSLFKFMRRRLKKA